MTRFRLGFIAWLALATSAVHATDVYIVIGQSNGWRLSSVSGVPSDSPNGKVIYFGMGCTTRPDQAKMQKIDSIHPSCQGRRLAEGLVKHSGGDIILVQYCVCGTSLYAKENWYPGDAPHSGKVNDAGLFASFQKYLADARRQAEAAGHTWNIKGIFWHQGESDANTHAAEYEKNFRHLVSRLRKEVKADVPIVAGHIRPLSDAARKVNQALDAVAADDPLLVTVPSADITAETPTDVHFNTEGCHEFGRQLAAAYVAMVKKKGEPLPK